MVIKEIVNANSSDDEIIAAVKLAGEHRYEWRPNDWPEKGSNNTFSWVKPTDIGKSTREDTSLLKRLREMAVKGLLEEKHAGTAIVTIRLQFETRFVRRMFPRFRVILK